jgi:Flp pilus assembly protein TadG
MEAMRAISQRSFIWRFLRNQRGNVFILTALGILMLVAVAGAAIDLGRQQLLRARIQQSTDAAALAAGSLQSPYSDPAQTAQFRRDTANRYFNLNFAPSYLGFQRPTPAINIGSNITVSGEGSLASNFVSNVGVTELQASGSTTVTSEPSSHNDRDVVLVIDESGSTGAKVSGSTTRIDIEKAALLAMLDNIFPATPTLDVRVGVVGYTGSISTMGGLTSNKVTVRNYINSLTYRCENYDHWGLEAGLNMVTGVWNGYKPPQHQCVHKHNAGKDVEHNVGVAPALTPRSDGKRVSDAKNIVLLGDGEIMREPPPYFPANLPMFDNQCTAVKNAGVTLYVINFISTSAADEAALRQCASSDQDGSKLYYYAPNAATLRTILSNIGEKIGSTHISD